MNPRIAILFCLLSFTTAAHAQNVMITEFKAVSRFPDLDWIEIHNAGTNTVNLGGWFLTDSRSFLTNWAFPSTNLAPGGFLVVYASGQDLRIPGQPLHTSFGLSRPGEYLALVRPDGRTIEQDFGPAYPPQQFYFSYGFPMCGGIVETNLPCFLDPTPGQPNPSPAPALPLAVTEVMYHPAPGPVGGMFTPNDFEFIELKNVGTNWLDLAGASLFAGVAATIYLDEDDFPPGGRILLVANYAAFQSRYGTGPDIAGVFSGSLSDSGERTALRGLNGAPGFDFTYRDDWHPVTDGHGFSLVPVDEATPPARYGQRSAWRASSGRHGSPGTNDPPSLIPPVLINEALTRPELPYEDAIELFNPGTNDVDIAGWFLTDDVNESTKYRLPAGAVVPAGGFLALDEHAFNLANNDPTAPGFGLNDFGEDIYLFSADAQGNLTGFAHGFKFGVAEPNVTFGRHVTSTGEEHFVPQTEMTFFATNSGPKVGPVVISEIHYHPPGESGLENHRDEFIELRNLTSQPVALSDSLFPTNSWQLRDPESNTVMFTFPAGAVIAPHGRLLVVSFDPLDLVAMQTFAISNNLTPGTPVFGPWIGQLGNDGGNLELVRPDAPEPLFVPYLRVERVRYSNMLPWPLGANGTGDSLHRIDEQSYGDDPANWHAAAPTPGLPGGFPLGFLHPLADQRAHVGSTILFDVAAVGTVPIAYQWRLNGVELPGATNRVLRLTNVQPSTAGPYSCFVSNAVGTLLSRNAPLGVFDTNPPSVLITTPPAPQIRVADSRFTISGTALDDALVTAVFIQNGPSLPITADGTSNWSATLELNPGVNTIRCFALDWAVNFSPTNTLLVLFQPDPARLGLNIQGTGKVEGASNGQRLRLGRKYLLRAIPAPGHHFTRWRDWDAKIVSTNPTLLFAMSPNLSLTANFEADSFLPFAGSYNGLFHSAANPAHLNAGYFTLRITSRGNFTGKLAARGETYALHGTFNPGLVASQRIHRAGSNDLLVNLRLVAGSRAVTGTVSELQFSSALAGHRSGFSAGAAATNFAGRYSTTLTTAGSASNATSTVIMSVSRRGQMTMRGRLPDRTPVARAVPAGEDGLAPLYLSIYRNTGSAFGWISLTNALPETLQGALRWNRTGPHGFTNIVQFRGRR